MENVEIPSRSGNFAERIKKIGRRVIGFIGHKLITVPSPNRETPSFRNHKDELAAELEPEVDVSPEHVLTDTFGVKTEETDADKTIIYFKESD